MGRLSFLQIPQYSTAAPSDVRGFTIIIITVIITIRRDQRGYLQNFSAGLHVCTIYPISYTCPVQVWTEDGTGGGFTDCGYWIEAFSPGVEKAFSSGSARFVCEEGLKHTLKPLNPKNVFQPGAQCPKYEVVVWPADCVV